jgi:uncharacterized protein YqgV (UPF0045/DUF77 family)
MTPKRKKVQDHVLSVMKDVDKSGYNYELYKKFFTSLNDKTFDNLMKEVKAGNELPIFANEKTDISISNNLKVGKKLGIDFFQRIYERDGNGTEYLTPVKYLVYYLPLRRTVQTAVKSVSTPENNLRRNNLTGQVTGPSKVTRMTLQEAQVLQGIGLNKTLQEFYKLRGGDAEATNLMVTRLVNTGHARASDILPFTSGAQATSTLKKFFTGAYLKLS